MFSSLFVVLLVIFGKYDLAAEMGLVTSFWLSITQIFSSNMRSIITSENNINLSKVTLYYSFIFSVFLLAFFYYLAVTQFNFIDQKLTLSISALILSQWIFEMIVLKFELSNKLKFFYYFASLNSLFVLLSIILVSANEFNIIYNLIFVYILIIVIFLTKDLLSFFKGGQKFFKVLKTNLNTVAFVSSFSIISSSFIWRLLI